jgi:hypothetical protein
VACDDLGRSAAIDLYAVAAVKALRGDPVTARALIRTADRYFEELGAALESHAIKARRRALEVPTDELRQRELITADESESVLGLGEAVEFALSLD